MFPTECTHCGASLQVPIPYHGKDVRCPACKQEFPALRAEERPFSFHCPQCSGSIEAEASWVGISAPCPHCHSTIVIPNLHSAPPPPIPQPPKNPVPSPLPPPAAQPQPKVRSSWTKHADWQLLPARISEALPCCPICRKRGEWGIHDKWGFIQSGYTIVCQLCDAEWEYITSKPQDLLFGGAVASMYRFAKIVNDDSIWTLRSLGTKPATLPASRLLNQEVRFSVWKQMVTSFCANCGKPLAEDERHCPACGTSR
jgi:hypothetical protein